MVYNIYIYMRIYHMYIYVHIYVYDVYTYNISTCEVDAVVCKRPGFRASSSTTNSCHTYHSYIQKYIGIYICIFAYMFVLRYLQEQRT